MAVPTTLFDVITLVAILLGSITAGLMFARPLPSRRLNRRNRARRPIQPVAAASTPLTVDPHPRRWPATSHAGLWSTSRTRRQW